MGQSPTVLISPINLYLILNHGSLLKVSVHPFQRVAGVDSVHGFGFFIPPTAVRQAPALLPMPEAVVSPCHIPEK